MIRIREIDHVVLRARDAAQLVRFYCDVLGCTIERREDSIGLVQLRAGRSLVDIIDVDGVLGRKGGAAPGAKDATSIMFACASSRSMPMRFACTSPRTASASTMKVCASAPKAGASRFMFAIPKATRSSSRDRRTRLRAMQVPERMHERRA